MEAEVRGWKWKGGGGSRRAEAEVEGRKRKGGGGGRRALVRMRKWRSGCGSGRV